MAVWVHLVAFVLLFVPMEVLTLLTTMGTLGVFGERMSWGMLPPPAHPAPASPTSMCVLVLAGAQDYRTINVQPGASDCREQAYLHGCVVCACPAECKQFCGQLWQGHSQTVALFLLPGTAPCRDPML